MNTSSRLDEDTARRILMVRAYEMAPEPTAAWGQEDRAWATRLARASLPAGAPAAVALAERSRHALHRLLPREDAARQALAWRGWHAAWLPLAVGLGWLSGLLLDTVGSGQHVNLLAPPVWAVLLWNLAVYALLLPVWPRRWTWRGLRGWLARRTAAGGLRGRSDTAAGPLARYARVWAEHGGPLGAARAALVLHAAAAALAVGLVTGLYLRGLVLDYRAGWQSTFLEAQQVQGLLQFLLAPAVALTGITVPDAAALQTMRLVPGATAAASAAPWIHLYAALLFLGVVLPRLGLAAWAGWRALHLSRDVQLPLSDPYFQRLLRALQGGKASVQVLPQGAAPNPQATLGLQAWLVAALGEGSVLEVAPATAYGQEEQAPRWVSVPGTTLRVLLVDLGATPEDDTHGRFLRTLRLAAPALPLLVLANEAVMRERFAHLPARLSERRAAWRTLAHAEGAGWCGLDLEHLGQADLDLAETCLAEALAAA